jgi:hypothetical protein
LRPFGGDSDPDKHVRWSEHRVVQRRQTGRRRKFGPRFLISEAVNATGLFALSVTSDPDCLITH